MAPYVEMTPYPYVCPNPECPYSLEKGEDRYEYVFEMGTAPKEWHFCEECGSGPLKRVYDTAKLQFSYGRDQFHGPTLKERQEKQLAECARDGVKAEPVGTRWV